MKKLFFIPLFILLMTVVANAASIRAVVDKTSMTLEETLTLTVIINDGRADIDVSAMTDFKIISTSSGSNYQWINGKTINEFKLNYILVPEKMGRLLIPSFTATLDGKAFTTEKIIINVTDSPVAAKDKRDVFVTAKVSEKHPYEGQQLIYTFSLYNAVQISGPSLQIPDFTGFVVKEEDDNINRRVVVAGRQYNVIEKNIILIPTKNGNYTIPPAVLNCNVASKEQQRRDPFDTFFNDSFFSRSRMVRKILRTNPLTIDVKELPVYPYDFNFSGVVGHVTMRAEIENSDLKTGDSTTLSIRIEGNGNIMDVEEPSIEVPAGFKIYKDNPEEEIKTGRDGYYGKKTFRTALVAVEAGNFTIPQIKFSYFDSDSGKYRKLTAGPFNVTIETSEEEDRLNNEIDSSAITTTNRPRTLKKKVEFTGHDLLPLNEDLDGIDNKSGMSFTLFIILLILPVLVTLGVRLLLTFIQRDKKASLLMLNRAEVSLKKAARSECSEEEFLSNIYKAFVSIVFSRASVAGESLTTNEARQILTKANFDIEVIDDVEQFIERLESLRFSGEKLTDELRKDFLLKTKQIIRIIKK